jgi:hypothetical protein
MPQRDEPYPADLHRLKAAALRESHRLRNETLWSTPGVLRRAAAQALVRLGALFRAVFRESAAPPGG